MSAVTLASLRADYAAAFKTAQAVPNPQTGYCKTARQIFELMDYVDELDDDYFHKASVVRASKLRELYWFAHQHGLNAAMLWKLKQQ